MPKNKGHIFRLLPDRFPLASQLIAACQGFSASLISMATSRVMLCLASPGDVRHCVQAPAYALKGGRFLVSYNRKPTWKPRAPSSFVCICHRLISAPMERAISYNDWYPGKVTITWSPGRSMASTAAEMASWGAMMTTSSAVMPLYSLATSSRSAGRPLDSV